MIKLLLRLLLPLFLGAAVTCSWADLTSRTYQSAKAAYSRGEWSTALELLKQYRGEDSSFLSANSGVSDAIAKAQSYCEGRTGGGPITGGVRTEIPPAPPLP